MSKAKTKSDQQLGENVILGGLGIQILFFGFFVITSVTFHRRIAARPTPRSQTITSPWTQHIYALYASSLLIMVRSVFRMVEFGMGNDSVLMESEAYLLGLDGALMLIVAVIFLWSHPSRALRGYGEDRAAMAIVDSAPNTAESFQMLGVGEEGRQASAGKMTPQGVYDASSDGTVMGKSGYGYEPAPRAARYSISYDR